MPDPEVNGARRVADALNWLNDAKLITLERHPGLPPTISLLSPAGDGGAYGWWGHGRYVRLPLGFWEHQWIYHLSATAVALLLVLCEMRGGRRESNPPRLTGRQRERYGLSDDTWTRARKELEQHRLLTVRRTPQGEEFHYRRLRNTYWLHVKRLDEPVGNDEMSAG